MEVGIVGLQNQDTFVSKAIRWWMNLYRRSKGLPKKQTPKSHVYTFVELDGEIIKVEAKAKGIVASRGYNIKRKDILLKPKKPLTNQEQEVFSNTAKEYIYGNIEYQFSNFIFQMLYIFLGWLDRLLNLRGIRKWYGEKTANADRRFYCSEFVAWLYYKTRGTFDHPERITPEDFAISDEFEELSRTSKLKLMADNLRAIIDQDENKMTEE